MSKKLAFIRKNILFYSVLPSEYHPLHHIHTILFSLGVILRPEADMRIWRILQGIVSYLKTSPLFFFVQHSPVHSYAALTSLRANDICPLRADVYDISVFRFL